MIQLDDRELAHNIYIDKRQHMLSYHLYAIIINPAKFIFKYISGNHTLRNFQYQLLCT